MASSRDTEPHYAGWSLWTGLSRLPSTSAAHGVLEGQIWNLIGEEHGRVFLLIDVGGGYQYWGLATNCPLPAGSDAWSAKSVSPASLLDTIRSWSPHVPHALVQDAIASTAPNQLLYLPIFDRTSPCDWTDRRRVALLGDAIHPTQPTGGQGAGMAIEDAEALAHVLSRPRAFDGQCEQSIWRLSCCYRQRSG
jgi:2-polyprenyl-6-methoxyphenol hydroxylase-like FAD-dependent oxidoreductase